MWQFIILGYVPGTDIQIGFDLLARFLAIVSVIFLTSLLFKEKKHSQMNSKQQNIESLNQITI